jgi:hypothetical protein
VLLQLVEHHAFQLHQNRLDPSPCPFSSANNDQPLLNFCSLSLCVCSSQVLLLVGLLVLGCHLPAAALTMSTQNAWTLKYWSCSDNFYAAEFGTMHAGQLPIVYHTSYNICKFNTTRTEYAAISLCVQKHPMLLYLNSCSPQYLLTEY